VVTLVVRLSRFDTAEQASLVKTKEFYYPARTAHARVPSRDEGSAPITAGTIERIIRPRRHFVFGNMIDDLPIPPTRAHDDDALDAHARRISTAGVSHISPAATTCFVERKKGREDFIQ
jgi:hypothetical protein